MPSPKAHWRVFLVAIENQDAESTHDHHAIYVDIAEGDWGMAYQVVGNYREGYEFMFVPFLLHPSNYPQVKWMQHVGWLAHGRLELFRNRCEYILPPGRQTQWGNIVPPTERIRTSETWAADVITRLQGEGYIEKLGWWDRRKGKIWVCAPGQKGPKRIIRRSKAITWHPSTAPNFHVWPQ